MLWQYTLEQVPYARVLPSEGAAEPESMLYEDDAVTRGSLGSNFQSTEKFTCLFLSAIV
jgi:hypothetical protein